MNQTSISTFKSSFLFALTVVLLGCMASALQAVTVNPHYDLRISTDVALLDGPNTHHGHMMAVWKTPDELNFQRSLPILRIENTSPNGHALTGFCIDINDDDYLFDTVRYLQGSESFNPQVGSLTDLTYGGDTTKKVDFTFGNPLDVGDVFYVELRIVPDPNGNGSPTGIDFRNILWDMNGGNANQDQNALVTAKFDGLNLPEVPLFDYQFANDNSLENPNDNTSGESMRFEGMHNHPTDAGIYFFEQSVVPEPGAWLLGYLGVASLLLFCKRRRLRRVAL